MTEYKKLTEAAKNLEKKGFCHRAVTQWRKAEFMADLEKERDVCVNAIKGCSGSQCIYYKINGMSALGEIK